VIGAIGMVLFDHPETTLQPLIAKFARMQQDLDEARRELAPQRRTKYTFASFIGSSPAALEVKRQARRAAQTDSTVLLLGETGTGKELLAHAIHAASARAERPFIGVNLAAVPETLMEADSSASRPAPIPAPTARRATASSTWPTRARSSSMRRATCRSRCRRSCCARCRTGDRAARLQQVIKVDVRVIAATSRDLKAMVADGRFREDLYYRLNVLPVACRRCATVERPGSARREPARIDRGAHRHAAARAEPSALAVLATHRWPGNIRELRNALEQAAMLTDNRACREDFAQVLPGRSAGGRASRAAASAAAADRGVGTHRFSRRWRDRGNKVSAPDARDLARDALRETGP
jgi:transcriptional regulator with PAS, ATPase and Fis domain